MRTCGARWLVMGLAAWVGLAPRAAAESAQPAARYGAAQRGDVVELRDGRTGTSVTVVPSVGNIATAFMVHGQNVLRFQQASLAEFKARPGQTGIPFMAPWINRLDEQAFYANGHRHAFDMSLGNVRGEVPIHGFVTTTDRWQVVSVDATPRGASVTSRLEFFRQPAWMRQWPYAHTISMTYRLVDGVLDVETSIENLSTEPMPVSVGFHPYFQLTDAPRDEWRLTLGARTRWLLDARKVPTGATEPAATLLPPGSALADYNLDDVFGDLVRDADGRSTTSVRGRTQQLDVVLGPNFKSVVIWAPNPTGKGRGGQGDSPPAERNFICIEPMAAITNALNMAPRGQYADLQSIPPGGTWRERFSVRPSGFEPPR
ncbi:MAG: aldose 1-epimerase [Vicinamibacterales bacterium]